MATGWLRLTVTMKFKSTTCWSERWFYNQVALFIVDRGWWFTVMILPFIFQTHCTVPIYSSAVSAMAFHPTTNCLFMVHADQQVISVFSFVSFHFIHYFIQSVMKNCIDCFALFVLCSTQMFEFSIEQKQYTDWSRSVQRNKLHHIWLERDTPVTNVMFDPKNPSHVILHDMYMLCVIDKSLVRTPLPCSAKSNAYFFTNILNEFMYFLATPWKQLTVLQPADPEEPSTRRKKILQSCFQNLQNL